MTMENKYLIGIDQSTQGTKALLLDAKGNLIKRVDKAHRQIIDPREIYQNTLYVVQELIQKTQIDKRQIAGLSISNQRETTLAWDRLTGEPIAHAIVWQCARAADICDRVEAMGVAEKIRKKTGVTLSPYFPASKIAWILEHVEGAREKAEIL